MKNHHRNEHLKRLGIESLRQRVATICVEQQRRTECSAWSSTSRWQWRRRHGRQQAVHNGVRRRFIDSDRRVCLGRLLATSASAAVVVVVKRVGKDTVGCDDELHGEHVAILEA